MSARIYRSAAAGEAVRAAYRAVLDGWPVPCEEIRVATREGETFVLACGPADAPPLVLLHGSQANAAVWIMDVPDWARDFLLYAVDMIGEPGFSAPSRPALDGEAYALWLDDVLAGIGVEKAAFVGTSLGGWLALDFAKRRPRAVERLALLCPAGIGRQKNFVLKVLPLLLLGPWGIRKTRQMVLGDPPAFVPDELKPFGALIDALGRGALPRMIKIPMLTDAELRALAMPILAIVGGRDVLIDSEETRRRLAATRPDAEIIYLSEGRHYLPDQTGTIGDFLRRGAS